MPLSPDARVITGADINENGTATRDIVAVVTATRTVDVGPDELLFPDPNIIWTSPGFGFVAFRIQDLTRNEWLAPIPVVLSSQAIMVPMRRVNLRGVALVPAVGCELDVETFRN